MKKNKFIKLLVNFKDTKKEKLKVEKILNSKTKIKWKQK